jgi:hypothetical protein
LEIFSEQLPSNYCGGMAAIRSKKTFMVWAGHSLLYIDPIELAATDQRSLVDAFEYKSTSSLSLEIFSEF